MEALHANESTESYPEQEILAWFAGSETDNQSTDTTYMLHGLLAN